MFKTILESEVVESLNRSLLAFNKGKSEFFEEFAKDATIYMADSGKPIKGREEYRQLYSAALCQEGREKTILDRTIQIIGDKAVVAQKARITEAEKSADVAQTMIYGQTNEGLKVLHMQTSLLNPIKAGASRAIEVVKERIGPCAAVVGVAQ